MKHISGEDVYNIQMALLRNYGYVARWLDVGDDDDLVIQVIDDSDRVVMTITVSSDGLSWVISGHHQGPVVLPLKTPLSRLAETIVTELEKPD